MLALIISQIHLTFARVCVIFEKRPFRQHGQASLARTGSGTNIATWGTPLKTSDPTPARSDYEQLHKVATEMASVLVGTAMQKHGHDPRKWPKNPLTQLVARATAALQARPAH